MDILWTNEANCKDCYKCIRYCPVNAIKVTDGHAQVDPERCILDGQCIKVCPQRAKSIRNDIEKVKEIIRYNNITIASIAPSFLAYYSKPKRGQILTALKFLGFNDLELTSRAAYSVAVAHVEHYKKSDKPVITSSCPSAVNLIEKYYPDLIPCIAPVVSPVVAHHKMLVKESRKPFKMIFIGPCVAKKEEVEDAGIAACLTFEEMEEWIKQEEIDIDSLEETDFENYYADSPSLFPLLGGLLKTAGLSESQLEKEIVSVNGIENIKILLESLQNNNTSAKFIEVLGCEGGCIMGPLKPDTAKDQTYFELKTNLLNTLQEVKDNKAPDLISSRSLEKTFTDKSIKQQFPSEIEIKIILASIGKTKAEHEHNCGACGYNSCREKAIAVFQGMAEKEMCIPYMRSQAERFSAIVLEATPNCVVVVDRNLNVIEANPAFLNMLNISKDEIKGKHISLLTDDTPFKEVLSNEEIVSESKTLIHDKELKRIVFSVPEQKLITGIFVDISDAETHKAALIKVRNETLERAQKVIDKQMRVAQEVAGLLGETTAETKVLLGQLVKILQQE
jgi:iron only hydrogenase large subunit-like protein